MIYLDNIAGTKPDKNVVDAVMPFIAEQYGNPSAHFYTLGRDAYQAVDKARKSVAKFINAEHAEEIYFTSNGTESNNIAIHGVLNHIDNKNKKHIITTNIEHYSVQNPILKYGHKGYKLTILNVNSDGFVNLDELKNAITDDTVLVAIQHANPEIGTIQEIEKIGEIVKSKNSNTHLHVDAVASAGILAIDVQKFKADSLTFAGQNIYSIRGAAVLYVKKGAKVIPMMQGGGQELAMRPGSENVAAIVGLGKAVEVAEASMVEYAKTMKEHSTRLLAEMQKMFDFLHITGTKDVEKRLPGHVSFWVEYIEGEALLLWYSINGIAVSSGSACASNILGEDEEDLKASDVLTAVGVPTDVCAGSITMSMSKYTVKEDVDKVVEVSPGIIQKLCEMSPVYNAKK